MCHYEFSSFSCTSLYYRHAQSSSYRVLNFKSVKKNRYEIYRDMNFILFLKHVNIQINLTRRRYDFFQFHIGQFSYRASIKSICLLIPSLSRAYTYYWISCYWIQVIIGQVNLCKVLKMHANPVSPCDRKTQNQNREAMK